MSNRTIKTCSINGCDRKVNARGWCKMHYSRWQRSGNPLGVRDPENLAKDRSCRVEGCENLQGEKGGRGWCNKHYLRWWKTGSPTGTLLRPHIDLFWEKVAVRSRNECWQWLGYRDPEGYGRFHERTGSAKIHITIRAHRWIYKEVVGDIPEGYVIDHLCRDRGCVNPSHLEAVTNQENLERGWGRRIKNGMVNECINGHEFTSDNTYLHPRGSKVCRTCTARSRRKYELRKKEAA